MFHWVTSWWSSGTSGTSGTIVQSDLTHQSHTIDTSNILDKSTDTSDHISQSNLIHSNTIKLETPQSDFGELNITPPNIVKSSVIKHGVTKANVVDSETFTGAARNAPNNGKNVKELLDQRTPQFPIITQKQVLDIKNNLKKTLSNAVPPLVQKPSIMVELDSVFGCGNAAYFEIIRKRRQEAKLHTSQTNNTKLISVPKVTSNTAAIEFTTENIPIVEFTNEDIPIVEFTNEDIPVVEFTNEDIMTEAQEFQNI